MPTVGASGKEPNDSYVEQLMATAQAAVDKIVEMVSRIGIASASGDIHTAPS